MLRIDSLNAFVEVIDAGSFSAAAERLGQTPSGVSRTIGRLEAETGTALLKRGTRRLDLTEEGRWLLERARQLLGDLRETEDQLAAHRLQPAGTVRLNASTPVLDHLIAPLAAEFLDAYPLVRLELINGKQVVDLIEEKVDVAIRIGTLGEAPPNARALGLSPQRLLASPAYVQKHGAPATVAELSRHRLLGFTAPAALNLWPLGSEGLAIKPAVAAASAETLRHLAVAGAGIACLTDFLTHRDIAEGRLVPLLPKMTLYWPKPIWAVYYKQGVLEPRVTALVDFLARRMIEEKFIERAPAANAAAVRR